MSKKILIVDDEEDIRLTMRLLLEAKGYRCDEAVDSEQAMELIKSELPDLILLDIMLPGKSGYRICWEIKNNEKYANIPIIFITAKTSESDRILAEQMKGNGYLEKPISKTRLLELINNYIGEP